MRLTQNQFFKRLKLYKLSNRIRIVSSSSNEKYSYRKKSMKYYLKYSNLALVALKETAFQSFLKRFFEKEEINKDTIKDIKIFTFPMVKKNGNFVAGRCNIRKGVVSIYPKSRAFCNNLKQQWGKGKIKFYIKLRAQATLLHETLHMKYQGKEGLVRSLTKIYINVFIRNKKPAWYISDINKKLFPSLQRRLSINSIYLQVF